MRRTSGYRPGKGPHTSLVLLIASLGGVVNAQQDRYQRTVVASLLESPGSPIISWSDSSLSIRLPDETTQSITVGIVNPGGYDLLIDGSEVYLAGRSATNTGRLVALRFDGQRYQLAWTYDEPDADYLGVAYSTASGRIYVLDGVDREVQCSAYAPPGGAPATWSVIADAANVPALAGSQPLDDYGLRLFEDGLEPTIRLQSVGRKLLEIYSIRHGFPNVQVSVYRSPLIDAARIVNVPLPGATGVSVAARATASVTLHRMDEEGWPQIASGTTGPSGELTLAYPPGLEWGAIYGVKDAQQSEPVGPFRTPQMTIGTPDPFPGHVILPFDNIGMQTWVSHEWFTLPLVLSPIGAPTGAPVTHDVMLNVGVLGSSNVHVLPDGRHLLEPLASVSTQLTTGGQRPFVGVQLPLNGDPNLVGVVLLFQWVIVADAQAEDYRLSEIAGPIVRGEQWIPPGAAELFADAAAAGGAKARQPTGSTALPAPRSGADQVEALRKHLDSLGFGPPAVPGFRRLLEELR